MKENKFIDNEVFQPKDEEEREKLEFFWNRCTPEDTDVTESIRQKTFRKIHEEERKSTVQQKRSSKTLYITIASVAASLLLLVAGNWFFSHDNSAGIKEVAALMSSVDPEDAEDITLMMSDSKKLQIETDSRVAYTSKGTGSVNSKSLSHDAEMEDVKEEKSAAKNEYNQLIVPKGKRSQLLLSDGTKVWVNSGTKVIYPRVFKGNKREIYVEGEIYLEVAHNAEKPFFVNASGFEVKVLGTCFDVFAYKQMEARVVLAEGSVQIKDNNEKLIKMVPNELVSIAENGIKEKIRVNANDYKAWIDGLMILDGENLNRLAERLSLYYGKKIVCDSSLYNETVYGKLDLRDDLNDIIDFIKSMIPLSAREENGVIYLYRE